MAPTGRARLPIFAVAAAVGAAATSCVLPARSTSAYRGKALSTTTAAISALESARFTADLAGRGRLTAAYSSIAMREAETDASAAQADFDSIQPPNTTSDRLRAQLDPLLADAVGTLSTLRIVTRRGDLDRLGHLAADAAKESRALQQFQEDHR